MLTQRPCTLQKGTYLPQTYIVHEEMVVTGKVHNMRQLGPFIYRLCHGKDTYRLSRRLSHRRECGVQHQRFSSVRVVPLISTTSCVSPRVCPPPPPGVSKRQAKDCHHIRHFENTFVVETLICDQA